MARSAAAAKPRASRAATAAPARSRTTPKRAPAQPRRRSGPATAPSRARERPRTKTAPRGAPVPLGQLLVARGNLLLDRLLRGRLWVGCVGVLLAGIVFLNVGLLQLNDQIARTDKKSGSIGRENAALRIRLAKLDSTERIQRLATEKGFVMPAPGAVRYVRAKSRDARVAARETTAPEPRIAPVPVAAPAPAVPVPAAPAPGTTVPGPTTTTPAPAPAPAATAPAAAQQVP